MIGALLEGAKARLLNLFDRPTDPDEADEIPADDILYAKRWADLLTRHYPGHLWGVQVENRQGIVRIYHLQTSGDKAFILKLDDMFSATDWDKKIMRAGGEILERHRLRRGQLDVEQWLDLPTDFAGRFKPDMN